MEVDKLMCVRHTRQPIDMLSEINTQLQSGWCFELFWLLESVIDANWRENNVY